MDYRILVAEDDKNINQVVCEYLKDSFYTAVPVYEGNSAKDIILGDEKIDLFILDIMLPGVSGLELLRLVKSDERRKDKPVIMLTALSDEYTQLESFNNLADDYVTKPFSPKVLVKRVEAHLRKSGAVMSVLTAGAITLNAESFEAFEEGTRLNLTLREYELLLFLASNRHKVLSRQQILDQVWGYDYFGDERIVDVHIKNLRKKLKYDVIDTVKGVGYKLQ